MSLKKQTISAEGRAEAEAELEHRTGVKRAEIRNAIKVAREFGDLKENAEYHAAREEQGLNEARIRVLEHHLANSELATGSDDGTAAVGSRVRYRDGERGESEVTLVHQLEADMAAGKVSVESPIGKALLGAAAGATVEVTTPRGTRELDVLDIA
jgi:transcription elongation factor GreA